MVPVTGLATTPVKVEIIGSRVEETVPVKVGNANVPEREAVTGSIWDVELAW